MFVDVIARPWPKFFSLGEDGIEASELEAKAVAWEVTEKMDGSMGLLFWDADAGAHGTWRVITKASFTSAQVYLQRDLSAALSLFFFQDPYPRSPPPRPSAPSGLLPGSEVPN